ncbi:MAG: methionine--tRNA ligase [Patescibacteria group bacterium]|jgi:methionyl-tRNA synthetase
MKNKFYITTTLAYVNAAPHIGFAMESVQADVVARFQRQRGLSVIFNTGVDEHGAKVCQKAQEAGMSMQGYCDDKIAIFSQMKTALNLDYDNFIRTTDVYHEAAVQAFWKKCAENGDIYKKNYKIKYCVGCELEKTESDLVEGRCSLHPNMEIETIEEENYFFRFSHYQEKLLELYHQHPQLVRPEKRMNEVRSFVEGGLQDFSISRVKSKMPWGVAIPGDEKQVMYVWFDALVNYISTLGWPNMDSDFADFWPGVQICGKDNLRQQAAMWQAMLFSAGLPNSKQIFINGFVNVGGQKMSKSLGNVVSPYDLVEKFGTEATRYLLLTLGDNFGEDMDFTWERIMEKYNADLANGLGNLVSRITKLSEQSGSFVPQEFFLNAEFVTLIDRMELSRALKYVWGLVGEANKVIDDNKPWELVKTDRDKFEEVMNDLTARLAEIAEDLIPFMPETAKSILTSLETKKTKILFERIKMHS